jgi:hypothetical protein
MNPGRIACALAVLAVLCVLALFFFPGMEGPYPAVHGPVTALLSIRAAARLRVLIRAGVCAMRSHFGRICFAIGSLSLISNNYAESGSNGSPLGTLSVLRC